MFIVSIWQETTKVRFNVLSPLSLQFSNQNSDQKHERKTRLFDNEVLANFGIVAAEFFWSKMLHHWVIRSLGFLFSATHCLHFQGSMVLEQN
jgi:hypothetical protein